MRATLAPALRARGGEAEHLGRPHGLRELEQLRRDGERLVEVADERLLRRPADDAEGDGSFLIRLGARAERRSSARLSGHASSRPA